MLKGLLKLTAFKLALLIGIGFAALHFVWRASNPKVFPFPELAMLDSKALDIKFQRRGPVPSSGSVVIAAVDEASIGRYGLWPWKREVVGRALQNLQEAGALAIGVDIVYSDADRSSQHLAVNRLVDEIVARATVETRAAELIDTALTSAKPPPGAELIEARQAALLEAGRLKEVREVALSSKLPDPDALLAEHLKQSPNVVLSVMGLSGDDLALIPAQNRERDEKALEAYFLTELYDRWGKVVTPEGDTIADWGPSFREKPADLERLHRVGSVQAPLPIIASSLRHVGLMDAYQDDDGTIRRYPLLTRVGDRLMPSLGLATSAVALGASIAPFKSEVLADGLDGVGLMSGDRQSGKRLVIPVNPWTGFYLINYPGSVGSIVDGRPLFEKVSLADVADGTFDKSKVAGKVVLAGVTAVGTFDHRVTPYDSFVPGIYTHAAVIDNVLSGRFLVQTGGIALFELALLLGLAILFGLVIPRFRMVLQLLFMIGVVVAYAALDLVLFRQGIVVSTVMPLFEAVALCFGLVVFNYVTVEREKRQVRTAFQYYLTKSVMEEMLKNPEKLKLGGDKREISVLFSDIRGFTTISERLPPEELVKTLNEYLTPMTDLVFRHEGTLDKYMGDAIMAIWGAPLTQEDHALRACSAAVEMLKALDELRRRWREQGRPDIDIGIGINSGPMAVGNMGSDMRFDYTVMGDNVNLGSRLEGTNKEYGTRIIISEFTYELVKGKVSARELGSVRVKGKKKPVVIYELRAIGAPEPQEAETIGAFEAGVKAYRARDWDGAERSFRAVIERWSSDGPSVHYLEDIKQKRLSPPPEGWDGVYEMKTK